ncbi:hypothetical protein GC207_05660 [bacterium]|nr:hypothetical protein [bacterium]
MKIAKTVENISTITELKRVASAYVIDYRNLCDEEIKAALIKTAPQYYHQANVENSLRDAYLNPDRNIRVLAHHILKNVLLQKDHFMVPKRELEDEIIGWEQSIVDRSNEDIFRKGGTRGRNAEMLTFVLETAWQNNNEISPDETNLVEKLRERLKISDREYRIIEAKIGKFPKPGNQLHTRGEIEETRRFLQGKGIIFPIRDSDGTDFDLIPEEIAATLRKVVGQETKRHGYRELLKSKFVRSKSYLADILEKCEIPIEGALNLDELQSTVMEHVKPTVVLGGLSPRDGLPIETLARWCAELGLNVSGSKSERIDRIVSFYDNLLEKDESLEDTREIWYQHFTEFARRNLEFLRGQRLIEKDLDVEHSFEAATDYLFEKKFQHKPLTQVGTNHADGAISFRDELIFWDNKSKETPVHLKDHLRQFDGYIKGAEKKVAGFLVIGPEFTPESSTLAMQYQVENGTTITLITAEEIRSIAERWSAKLSSNGSQDPFPLGYLVQPGRFNMDLVAAL